MKRVNLFMMLNNIIPTYSVGQIRGTIEENCCVLRRGVDVPSTSNRLGHWDSWYIDIYSPFSLSDIDDIIHRIRIKLKEVAEIENLQSGDYYDEVLRAFSNTMMIRIPNIY